jgi:ribosome-associated protein
LADKKRGNKLGGGAGDGNRPRIGSSHTGRPHDTDAVGGAPRTFPRPRRRPPLPASIRAGKNGKPLRRPEAGPAAPRSGGPRVRKARPLAPSPPSSSIASDEARSLAILIAIAALEKKAVSVEVLDVAGRVDYADFLVLMTGRSDRQVQAIAQGIEESLKLQGRRAQSVEGLPHASWVLMDYSDVVVHVFQDEARSAYDLEGLWMDASRIPVPVPPEG